jgi:ankyrin repeat protein
VTYSARPLSLDELRHALAVDEDTHELDPELDLDHPQDVMSSCAGLVVVDSESNIVRLVHYTTQSFLESYSDNLLRDPHGFLTIICLNYLHLDALATHVSDEEDYPFLRYSAEYWNLHLSRASSPTHLRKRAFAFLDHVGRVTAAFRALSWIHYRQHGLCALHFLAYRGLDDWIIDYIRRGQPSEGKIRQEPLCTECGMSVAQNEERRKEDSMSWGKALTSFRDSEGRTPLWYAIQTNQVSTAQLLLAINDQLLNDEDNNHERLLTFALKKGADAIALQILEKPAMISWRDYRDEFHQTYLHQAVLHGKEAVFYRLLELVSASELIDPASAIGSFTAVQGHRGRTALFDSASCRSANIVKTLLDYSKGLELNIPDDSGRSPLSEAALSGNSEVVKLLLDQENIQTSLRDRFGRNALHWAAIDGSVATISCLIESGKFPADSTDRQGRTPLSYAAELGQLDAILFLLSRKDVDVQSVDDDGVNALMYASRSGHSDCVAVLAPMMHNINATDVHGCTVLHQMTSTEDVGHDPFNYASCLETLINQGASLDIRNNANESAYDICCRRLSTLKETPLDFIIPPGITSQHLEELMSVMNRHMPTIASKQDQDAPSDTV